MTRDHGRTAFASASRPGVDQPIADARVPQPIGIDITETKRPNSPVQYFGKEAAAFTRRLAEGNRIRLEYDQANAAIDHRDRYDRTLAYVFLADNTLLNAEIIQQGYGQAFTRFPFSRMEEFRRLESDAREKRRGL